MDPENLTHIFRTLALRAGALIMDVYNSDDMGVEVKSDDSPVTRADQLADAHIYAGLRAAFPDIPIVTEEQANTHTMTAKTFIIVDPLDGTKEFVHRRGDFTVNIAYVVAGRPVSGVVYAPAKKRLFYTDAAGRAVEETGDLDPDTIGQVTVISVATPDPDALIVVASKSHRDQALEDYIAKYPVRDSRAAGSSLKFCLLATGEADLYPRLGRTMEWDTAAGHAVLAAAGGHVVRFDDHTPLAYGKDGFENPFFIAYGGNITLQGA